MMLPTLRDMCKAAVLKYGVEPRSDLPDTLPAEMNDMEEAGHQWQLLYRLPHTFSACMPGRYRLVTREVDLHNEAQRGASLGNSKSREEHLFRIRMEDDISVHQ